MNTKAIVTLVAGERHVSHFTKYARPTWEKYCDNHNLDLVFLTEPLDHSEKAKARSPAWQKCLVLEHPKIAQYEQYAGWILISLLIQWLRMSLPA